MLLPVNFVAVFFAAVVGMAIGALYYSPLVLGNLWMKLTGLTKKDMEKAKEKGMGKSYLTAFIATLVMSYVLAQVISYMGAWTLYNGIWSGFLMWLGFVATIMINTVLWEGKPVKLYVINIGNYFVQLIVMGAVLAAMA